MITKNFLNLSIIPWSFIARVIWVMEFWVSRLKINESENRFDRRTLCSGAMNSGFLAPHLKHRGRLPKQPVCPHSGQSQSGARFRFIRLYEDRSGYDRSCLRFLKSTIHHEQSLVRGSYFTALSQEKMLFSMSIHLHIEPS